MFFEAIRFHQRQYFALESKIRETEIERERERRKEEEEREEGRGQFQAPQNGGGGVNTMSSVINSGSTHFDSMKPEFKPMLITNQQYHLLCRLLGDEFTMSIKCLPEASPKTGSQNI